MRTITALLICLIGWTSPALGQSPDILIEYNQDFLEERDEYGQDEIDGLIEELSASLSQSLNGSNHDIVIIINDLTPNRPTREMRHETPNLSYDSLYRGGGDFTARILDENGHEISQLEYDWYVSDIAESAYKSTWTDARRALDRFADRLTERVNALAAG